MIYLAVTSRTWPAWSTPEEDGNWQKIFLTHRAKWKIFGKKISATSRHVKTSCILQYSYLHSPHSQSPLPLHNSPDGDLRNGQAGQNWNLTPQKYGSVSCQTSKRSNMKWKEESKHLKVLPVTRRVIALAELPGDGLGRVTSAPAALTRTTTRADRSTWWRVGRSGEKDTKREVFKDTKRCKQQRWHLQVDSGLSGFVWLPEHSQERPK